MSTGLLLFLIFMALSIIDSVARSRRSQQQKQVPPPEDGADEEWRAEPSAQREGDQAEKREPGEALGELLGLEKLMGPGYLDKLMGPGVAGAIQDEEEAPEEPAGASPPTSDERRRRPSMDRDERRAIARDRRTSDQERRRAEAGRPSRVEREPGPGRRRAVQGPPSDDDRRLPSRRDERSRPAAAARETAPLQDSAVDRGRDDLVPMPGVPTGAQRRVPARTRLYRELFGGGDRDSLRRAFVLKEILDAPASERPPDQRAASQT